jgi:hypothetical protein
VDPGGRLVGPVPVDPGQHPLHQLHLLLVHTALSGALWRDAVVAAAEAALRAG